MSISPTTKRNPISTEWPPLGWLTKKQAAERLGLSEPRIAALATAGKLQSWKQPNPESKQPVTLIRAGDVERVICERDNPGLVLPSTLDKSGDGRSTNLPALLHSPYQPFRAPEKMERPWLTISEAADYTGLPASVIERLVKSGALPGIDCGPRPGGRWRVKRTDLDKLEGER